MRTPAVASTPCRDRVRSIASSAAELARRGVGLVRAHNPGLLTLEGTNTWIVGDGGAWVVDPGPALESHLDAVAAEVQQRGGLAGIALTHRHHDHAEGIPGLLTRRGYAPVVEGGADAGPLRAVPTPGHSPDHHAYVLGDVAFTGDAVLGAGSVFVSPGRGALVGYLAGLRRLRAEPLALLCPGHGPVVDDPASRIDGYLAHRLEREAKLVDALDDGARTVEELLDAAWPDAPAELRFAAALTLAAHLDKLEEEDRLPDGVERPAIPPGHAH